MQGLGVVVEDADSLNRAVCCFLAFCVEPSRAGLWGTAHHRNKDKGKGR